MINVNPITQKTEHPVWFKLITTPEKKEFFEKVLNDLMEEETITKSRALDLIFGEYLNKIKGIRFNIWRVFIR